MYFSISGRCSLDTVVKESDEFFEDFAEQLFGLNPHGFISKQQSEFLKETKNNLKPNEFVVISDFSENYTFVVQDEIQAFHWANEQCTVHPIVIYFKTENGDVEHINYVVIAESLTHNAAAVFLFHQKMISFLRDNFDSIEKIFFFSDGAASQYKNKTNFHNLCEFEAKHKIKVEWHFFASYHGKGPCDGLGGTVKRMATQASLRRLYDGHILTATDLFEWLRNTDTNFHVVFCSQKEQDQSEKLLNSLHRRVTVKTVPGTQSYHAFIPAANKTLLCKRYSFSENTISHKFY